MWNEIHVVDVMWTVVCCPLHHAAEPLPMPIPRLCWRRRSVNPRQRRPGRSRCRCGALLDAPVQLLYERVLPAVGPTGQQLLSLLEQPLHLCAARPAA